MAPPRACSGAPASVACCWQRGLGRGARRRVLWSPCGPRPTRARTHPPACHTLPATRPHRHACTPARHTLPATRPRRHACMHSRQSPPSAAARAPPWTGSGWTHRPSQIVVCGAESLWGRWRRRQPRSRAWGPSRLLHALSSWLQDAAADGCGSMLGAAGCWMGLGGWGAATSERAGACCCCCACCWWCLVLLLLLGRGGCWRIGSGCRHARAATGHAALPRVRPRRSLAGSAAASALLHSSSITAASGPATQGSRIYAHALTRTADF